MSQQPTLTDEHRARTIELLRDRTPELRKGFNEALRQAIEELEVGSCPSFRISRTLALTTISASVSIGPNPLCLSDEEGT